MLKILDRLTIINPPYIEAIGKFISLLGIWIEEKRVYISIYEMRM